MMRLLILLGALGLAETVLAKDPVGFEDGSDLENFVTRPELRAARYVIKKHEPTNAIADGYWFVAHYPILIPAPQVYRKEHLPCQTGPHIYDGDGNLVWSGACEYHNKNVFNFKPVFIDGGYHLSFFASEDKEDGVTEERATSAGVLMNNHYDEVSRIYPQNGKGLDIHEYTITKDEKSVLVSTSRVAEADASDLNQEDRVIISSGFQEIELKTGKLLFEWDPWDDGAIKMNESCDARGKNDTNRFWDYFHINSIDKFENGDYLVSGRHTGTVYRISGQDGRIVWRLGGYLSEFDIDADATFTWQHHAKVRTDNGTHVTISLFDNASEDEGRNPDMPQQVSWAKILVVDTTSKKASLLRGFERPDGGSSKKLGSVQTIGDDPATANIFVGWAQHGFISEYGPDNKLLLEARLQSDRMSTYRAYKYPFVGVPKEAPVLKVIPIAYGDEVASTFYVSWNGATEVTAWRFFGSMEEDGDDAAFRTLATVTKNGFETSWVMLGSFRHAFVEALDVNGKVLRRSNTTVVPVIEKERYAVVLESLTEETLEESQDRNSTMTKLTAQLLFLFVHGLALYGAYCMAKAVMPELMKRRRGYRKVATLR